MDNVEVANVCLSSSSVLGLKQFGIWVSVAGDTLSFDITNKSEKWQVDCHKSKCLFNISCAFRTILLKWKIASHHWQIIFCPKQQSRIPRMNTLYKLEIHRGYKWQQKFLNFNMKLTTIYNVNIRWCLKWRTWWMFD